MWQVMKKRMLRRHQKSKNISGKKSKNKKNNNKKPKELTAEQKRKIEVIRKKNILLNIYEKHPFMYIKSHPDHSNRDKRHNLWVLITKEIGEKKGKPIEHSEKYLFTNK